MLALVSSLAAASLAPCLILAAPETRTPDHAIRLANVVDLSCIEVSRRAEIGDAIILEAPERGSIALSRRALANLVHRRMPALSDLSAEHPNDMVRFYFGQPRFVSPALPAHRAFDATNAPPSRSSEPPIAIQFGDVLLFDASFGPVTIERRVTAMQNSAGGEDIFVKSDDGEIFSLPVAQLRHAEPNS